MIVPSATTFNEAVTLAKQEIKKGFVRRYMVEKDRDLGLTISVLTDDDHWRLWWAEFENEHDYIFN
jgi:hypothetical protein